MPKHVWSVVCRKAVTDRDENSVSLHEVIEMVTVSQDPLDGEHGADPVGIPLQHDVTSLWTRENREVPERASTRTRIRAPNGREFKGPIAPLDLTHYRRLRSNVRFQSFPYVGPGDYALFVDVSTDEQKTWRTVAELPLEIALADTQDE